MIRQRPEAVRKEVISEAGDWRGPSEGASLTGTGGGTRIEAGKAVKDEG